MKVASRPNSGAVIVVSLCCERKSLPNPMSRSKTTDFVHRQTTLVRKITSGWANDNDGVSNSFALGAIKWLSLVSIFLLRLSLGDGASACSEWSPFLSQRPRVSSQHAVSNSTADEDRRRRVTARGVHLGTWSTNPLSMSPVRAQPPLLWSPALFLSLPLCPRHTLNPSLTMSRVPGRKRGSEKWSPDVYANALEFTGSRLPCSLCLF